MKRRVFVLVVIFFDVLFHSSKLVGYDDVNFGPGTCVRICQKEERSVAAEIAAVSDLSRPLPSERLAYLFSIR